MKFIYKILNRLRLLKLINVNAKISVRNQKYLIPIIQGIGITNINHKESWFTELLSKFDNYYSKIIFLDIGANIGQTLLNVKTINSEWEYIGFEPNSSCHHYLKQLIRINKFSNTEIYPVAASNSLNIIKLYSLSKVDSSATIIENFRANHYKNGYKEIVIGLDLDTLLLSKFYNNKNYLIKIDIEGAELLAIEGMQLFLNKSRAFIICEVLDTHSEKTLKAHELRLQKLELLMKNNNYNIYQIIKNKTAISSLKLIINFEIKLWTSKSINLNDFLFAPKEKENILTKFYKLN